MRPRDSPVDSRISAVTVYQDRAVVTRTATVDLAAGSMLDGSARYQMRVESPAPRTGSDGQ